MTRRLPTSLTTAETVQSPGQTFKVPDRGFRITVLSEWNVEFQLNHNSISKNDLFVLWSVVDPLDRYRCAKKPASAYNHDPP
jgi:hypothetical protein